MLRWLYTDHDFLRTLELKIKTRMIASIILLLQTRDNFMKGFICVVDVAEIPDGQVVFEGRLHGFLKGAWGSLLPLFWELMFFIRLPNHPGWQGSWKIPSATSC